MRLAMAVLAGEQMLLLQRHDKWVNASSFATSVLMFLQKSPCDAASLDQLAELPPVNITDVQWLPPIARPSKILAIGRNYAEHATEQGADIPTEPIIFSILPSALVGHEALVQIPTESSQVDFEAELVVVIGRPGRRIAVQAALQHVAGYMCGNDITARDWQKGKPGGQWLLGKSFDTFAPTGPWLVTADEISDPQGLQVEMKLNGRVMQSDSTRQQMFPVAELVAYLSNVATLETGDLIFTGTPSGVGVARKPPVFLKSGDRMEVTIDSIGTLSNSVA